jgi:very-short-patch-repair endonuclease
MAKPNGKICVICRKELIGQQGKCCSRACANQLNSINKSGVKFSDEHKKRLSKALKKANSNSDLTERRKKTCQERYGGDAPACSNEVKTKIKSTNQERYGGDAPACSDRVMDKIKSTNQERYGVDFTTQHKETKEKMVSTLVENYGVETPFNSETIREKSKQTILERFGVEHPAQSKKVMDKMQATNQQRYGVPNIKQSNLSGIWKDITNQKWWDSFSSFGDIKDTLSNHLSLSPIYYYTKKYRPDLVSDCTVSSPHQRIITILQELDIDFETNTRKVIAPLELDIYIPSHDLAIEVNGIYWHSEVAGGKDRNYHLNKTIACQEKGITLLHLWDIEIEEKPEIVKSMILSRLGLSEKRIFARKCNLVEVDSTTANQFFNTNHLQGGTQITTALGLQYNNELICCMAFIKSRYNKSVEFELTRYASKIGVNVVGGFSRILKNWGRDCISYSDRRYSIGGVYKKNGFDCIASNSPSYKYISINGTLVNRLKYQKHKLSSLLESFDSSLTEWENMQINGFDRVWDCGTESWLYSHNP